MIGIFFKTVAHYLHSDGAMFLLLLSRYQLASSKYDIYPRVNGIKVKGHITPQ